MKKKIIGILLIFLVVLIGIGVYAVDKVFNMLLYQQIALEDSADYSNVIDGPHEEQQDSEELLENPDTDTDKMDINKEEDPVSNNQDKEEDKEQNKAEHSKNLVPEKTINNQTKENKIEQSNKSSARTEKMIISNEAKIKEIEKQVSFSDKAKAFSILFSSLTAEDRARLLQMAKGGVTQEERAEAIQILARRLNREQKDVIKSLYGKYEYLLYE